MRLLEVLRGGELKIVERQRNREVEAIIRRFINDDEAMFCGGKLGEIDVVFGGGE